MSWQAWAHPIGSSVPANVGRHEEHRCAGEWNPLIRLPGKSMQQPTLGGIALPLYQAAVEILSVCWSRWPRCE